VREPGIIPTGYERTLPPEAQLITRARRRALVRRATGRVLDLGGADTHRALWATARVAPVEVLDGGGDPRLAELVASGERFDTVVSVFQLAAAADLDPLLAAVRSVLSDDGALLFLEPTRVTGPTGRLQRLAAPAVAATTGWRTDHDVPMALRRAGLSVTDVERHRVPTLQPWLRQLVEGRAHRALLPRPASDL
jgi:SAM-dependent methyltransferase